MSAPDRPPGRSPARLTSRISEAKPGCPGQPDRAEPRCAEHDIEIGGGSPVLGP
jgi:hypothetical protein